MADAMQIIETENAGLSRGYKVTLSAAHIEKTMEARLVELSRDVQIPGFRPGKIPMPLLKQRYAASVLGEVVERAVNEGADKVLSEKKIRPVQQPKVELSSFIPGADVEFTLSVEIMPEFTLAPLDQIAINKIVAEAPQAEIDEHLTSIAERFRDSQPLTKPRAAKMGDIAVIDFAGRVDGEARPGMEAQGHAVTLGSKSLIDTFEAQIAGMNAGEKKTITVTFPAEYHEPSLSGKAAEFDVTLTEIREPVDAVVDDALAQRAGAADLADLKTKITQRLQRSYDSMTRLLAKRALMDALAKQYDFEVPASLLDPEFQSIWTQIQKEKADGNLSAADAKRSETELEQVYREIAARRVRLGLVLAEIGRTNNVTIRQDDLNRAVMAEAQRYPGQEQAVFEFYARNPKALDRLRAPLYEEAVVDFVLGKAKISEQKSSVEDLQAALSKLEEEV